MNPDTPILLNLANEFASQGFADLKAICLKQHQKGMETYREPLTSDTDIDPIAYALDEQVDNLVYLELAYLLEDDTEKSIYLRWSIEQHKELIKGLSRTYHDSR